MKHTYLFFFTLLFASPALKAQETEIQYLSGTGCDHTVNWQFFCTGGQNSGKWTQIPVPSNWELEGFGTYNYRNDKPETRGKETGMYKYEFQVPKEWRNKQAGKSHQISNNHNDVLHY